MANSVQKHQERVVFLCGPGPESHIVFHALNRHFNVVGAVMEGQVSRRMLVERRIKRLGLARVVGQLGFQLLIVPALRVEGQRRAEEIKQANALNTDPIPAERLTRVDTVNSEEAREVLRSLKPDVVVINGTRIIGKKTLECIDAPFVNTHAGITPQYRGVHGGYWAMRNQDHERFGVTVHLVDTGIDTGKVLAHGTCVPSAEDNFYTYPYLQLATGVPLLIDSVSALLEGRARPQEFNTRGTPLWYHPTAADYIAGRLLEGVR